VQVKKKKKLGMGKAQEGLTVCEKVKPSTEGMGSLIGKPNPGFLERSGTRNQTPPIISGSNDKEKHHGTQEKRDRCVPQRVNQKNKKRENFNVPRLEE